MADTIAVQVLERTTGKFVSEVFPSGSKPFLAAAGTILRGIVRTGTTVLSDLGRTMGDGETGEKGVRERLSGWLERRDVSPAFAGYCVVLVAASALTKLQFGRLSRARV